MLEGRPLGIVADAPVARLGSGAARAGSRQAMGRSRVRRAVTTAGARRGGGSPVVTGRKIGLRASGGNESAKHFLDAGVMTRDRARAEPERPAGGGGHHARGSAHCCMTGQRFSPRHRRASRASRRLHRAGRLGGRVGAGRWARPGVLRRHFPVRGRGSNRQLPANLFDGQFDHRFPVLARQPRGMQSTTESLPDRP